MGNDFTLPIQVDFAFINDCSDEIFMWRKKKKIYIVEMFWYMFPVWDVLRFVYCIVSRSRIKVSYLRDG